MMVENRYACFEDIRALEKAIFGKKPFDNVSSLKDREEHEREFIKQSLIKRQQRLNVSCPDTEENRRLFWEVTRQLVDLIQLNHSRSIEIVSRLIHSPTYSYETDWCIQSGILVESTGAKNVLEDEMSYGSNFFKMRALLSELSRYLNRYYGQKDLCFGLREYWRSDCVNNPMLSDWNQFTDDPNIKNWLTYTADDCQWLNDQTLEIPHIVHEMLDNNYWSVPDYLHLSGQLRSNVRLLVQHYVDDHGGKIIEV